MKQRIVLDTNCLIASLSAYGKYYGVWQSFVRGEYTLCYSTEILLEYEEILSKMITPSIAQNVVELISNSPSTVKVDPSFRFHLITKDPDDNKFVDCAITANASYIVSEDSHFKEVARSEFPHLDVIRLRKFLELLTPETRY